MIPSLKFSIFLTFFMFLNDIPKGLRAAYLTVTDDGPAVLGSNVTFFAVLSDYSPESSLTYTFSVGVQDSLTFTSTSLNVSVSKVFSPEQYGEGQYRMDVSVIVTHFFLPKVVAANFTNFVLKRSLIGEIHLHQGNRSINKDIEDIAVGENFTAVVDLHDPNHYLKDAVIDYSWSFDMDTYLTSSNSFIYNFSDVGEKLIIVKPTATFPDSRSLSGFFSKRLAAKIPVKNVTVSGNPFLHHGDFLLLNISCSGTPPFTYCSEILKENVTTDNFTCTQTSTFTSCHMEIKRFLTDGKYNLGIYIGNDVREVKKIMEIMVYNVSIKPTLSTIIIPIICSLLTLIIIAIGISFYIQQRNQLAVEVADFDFQDESDSFSGERTFFEKVFDSFACRNCTQSHWSCVNNRSESDPLLNDESLPYV